MSMVETEEKELFSKILDDAINTLLENPTYCYGKLYQEMNRKWNLKTIEKVYNIDEFLDMAQTIVELKRIDDNIIQKYRDFDFIYNETEYQVNKRRQYLLGVYKFYQNDLQSKGIAILDYNFDSNLLLFRQNWDKEFDEIEESDNSKNNYNTTTMKLNDIQDRLNIRFQKGNLATFMVLGVGAGIATFGLFSVAGMAFVGVIAGSIIVLPTLMYGIAANGKLKEQEQENINDLHSHIDDIDNSYKETSYKYEKVKNTIKDIDNKCKIILDKKGSYHQQEIIITEKDINEIRDILTKEKVLRR